MQFRTGGATHRPLFRLQLRPLGKNVGSSMTTQDIRAWVVTQIVTLVLLSFLAFCVAIQNMNGVPESLIRLSIEYGGFVLAGYLLSSLVLFVLSLTRWRRLSKLQRSLGIGFFALNVILYLMCPVL